MPTWPRFRTPPYATQLALPLLLLSLVSGPTMTWAGPLFEAPFLSYDMGHAFAPGFAVGDVNEDGRLDLVACSEPIEFNGFTVRLGNGDGTFGPRIDHDLQNGFSESLILANLDQDNHLDVAVTNAGSVMVRFGNGDGTFRPGLKVGANYSPENLTAVDLNGDQLMDLVFRRETAYQVYALSVMLGTGNGTFGPIHDFPLAGNQMPQGLALGDVNGDHRVDAVVPIRDAPLKILLGNGDGTFAAEMLDENYYGRIYGRQFALSDVNHDDQLDAVIPAYPDTVLVLLGLGNGHFGPGTPFESGPSGQNAVVADLDSDGNVDVVVTNTSNGTVSVLRGLGDGTFGPHAEFPGGSGTLAVGDFDRDQIPDVAIRQSVTVSILLGNGDATFGKQRGFSGPDYYSFNRITAGDLNGDTRPDLIISGYYNIGIHLGNGDGTFAPGTVIPEPAGARAIALADFDEDGRKDLAVSSGWVYTRIYFGNGDGTFHAGPDLPLSDESRFVAVADLNRDSHDDVIASVSGAGISVFFGNGHGGFGKPRDFATVPGPYAVAVGDLNGDQWPDLVATGAYAFSVLLNDGAGGFGAPTDYPSAGGTAVALARLNADAALDLVIGGTDFNAVVRLGNGDGTFGPSTTYEGRGDAPLSLVVADFNDDGAQDIAINGFPNCCIIGVREGASVLLGNGDGTFQPPQNYGGGVGSTAVAGADFDGNGSTDLAVACFYSYSVSVFLNTTVTNEAPDCSRASASVSTLWPPNHKFVPVSIEGVTDPEGDPVTIVVSSVTQDESVSGEGGEGNRGNGGHGGNPSGGGRGGQGGRMADSQGAVGSSSMGALASRRAPSDGGGGAEEDGAEEGEDTCADAILLDNGQVKLRGERLGTGNGRVYVIAFTARDAAGGECSGTVQVCVPHNSHGTCVDDGQAYNSLGTCSRPVAAPRPMGLEAIALSPRSSNGTEMTFEFALPEESDVVVAAFDISGRRLATLENSRQSAGWHTVTWNTSGVRSGIYYVRMRAGSQAITKAVRVLR